MGSQPGEEGCYEHHGCNRIAQSGPDSIGFELVIIVSIAHASLITSNTYRASIRALYFAIECIGGTEFFGITAGATGRHSLGLIIIHTGKGANVQVSGPEHRYNSDYKEGMMSGMLKVVFTRRKTWA